MSKTARIFSIILMIIPSLMLTMSAIMKLIGTKEVVEGLGKMGLGNYVFLFGVIEILSVALFLIPKTCKIGFLLLCSYLGGAMSIELASGQAPMAAVFIAVLWISVFLRDKAMFLPAKKAETK
ncbi:MAG: DoxX family protein [Bacteroidia bacterium]|nr:DoxX family protein [Bacteroidia bacterium]